MMLLDWCSYMPVLCAILPYDIRLPFSYSCKSKSLCKGFPRNIHGFTVFRLWGSQATDKLRAGPMFKLATSHITSHQD